MQGVGLNQWLTSQMQFAAISYGSQQLPTWIEGIIRLTSSPFQRIHVIPIVGASLLPRKDADNVNAIRLDLRRYAFGQTD